MSPQIKRIIKISDWMLCVRILLWKLMRWRGINIKDVHKWSLPMWFERIEEWATTNDVYMAVDQKIKIIVKLSKAIKSLIKFIYTNTFFHYCVMFVAHKFKVKSSIIILLIMMRLKIWIFEFFPKNDIFL